jgi:hypothetical protein
MYGEGIIGTISQTLVSFKKYMPPPLHYFKVNIYPFPLPLNIFRLFVISDFYERSKDVQIKTLLHCLSGIHFMYCMLSVHFLSFFFFLLYNKTAQFFYKVSFRYDHIQYMKCIPDRQCSNVLICTSFDLS